MPTSTQKIKYRTHKPDLFDEVEIGDAHKGYFRPHAKMKKWGEECWMRIWKETEGDDQQPLPIMEDGKSKWKNGKEEVHFYPLGKRTLIDKGKEIIQLEDGGFEFEVILKEKPDTNEVVFKIETQDLVFHYQPELTQEQKDNGWFRPENVIGSFVIKHILNKKMHPSREEAEKYKNSKAFHIYRPKITDSNGWEVWGEFDKDPDKTGKLRIEIPIDFWENAVYPIMIDPTIGYDTAGSSAIYISSTLDFFRRGISDTTNGVGGVVDFVKVSLYGTTTQSDVTCRINETDSVAEDSHGQKDTETIANCVIAKHWEQFNLNGITLEANTAYLLNVFGEILAAKSTDYMLVADTDGSFVSYEENSSSEDPWTQAPMGTAVDYSIYCSYTGEGPAGPANVKSVNAVAIADVKSVNTVAIADVKSINGVD